jgi:uncharacterized protein
MVQWQIIKLFNWNIMRILFDIGHPAHLNFFRNAIIILQSKGNEIIISYLQRGKVPKIVQKEYPGFRLFPIGVHKGTKVSIILQANILRFIQHFNLRLREKYDIGVSVNSIPLGAVCKLTGIPNIQFDDDIERKLNVYLERKTANSVIFPEFVGGQKWFKTYCGLKEWAYLSPKYFKPNIKVLETYNLTEKKYIFVREVDTGSFNYGNQKANLIASVAAYFPADYEVVLSLENKNFIDKFPKDWILLNEPVEDIHSLIYFSKFLISSGDSMAREGGMLGIPSIYCGIREMKANNILIQKDILKHIFINEVPDYLVKYKWESVFPQDEFRGKLLSDWDDVTELIIKEIEYFIKKIKQ